VVNGFYQNTCKILTASFLDVQH